MSAEVLVDENGDLTVYTSIHEAEAALEPVDVLNKEYVVYDAKGRVFDQVVSERRVKLILPLNAKVDAGELEKKIQYVLARPKITHKYQLELQAFMTALKDKN